MKKFLFAAAFALATIPAMAQTGETTAPARPTQQSPSMTPAAPGARQTNRMQPRALAPAEQRAVSYSKELQQKLNLTPDQYTKVLSVNTECIKRKDAMKQSGATNFKEISTYRMQEYQTILTPDQMTKLKAMNTQMNPKNGNAPSLDATGTGNQ